VMLTEVSDSESTLAMVEETLLRQNFVTPQDNIIISGGLPIAARGPANFVKLSTVSPKTPAAFWQLKGI